MKNIIAMLCLVTTTTHASTLLDFRPNFAGDGISNINVTSGGGKSAILDEVANKLVDGGGRRDGTSLPILGDFGGTGLNIDGQEVNFTITSIIDYNGGSDAHFRTDMNGNGLGIETTSGVDRGKWFEIDGQESFTLRSDSTIQFEGLALRNWSGVGNREFSISSNDWINLLGVDPSTGITFDSTTGTFTFREVVGNVITGDDGDYSITLEEMVGQNGPSLDLSNITVANTNVVDVNGFALKTMTFAKAVAVPEPNSSILMGIGGMVILLRRYK